jgi:hypothetical protein
MFMAGGLEGFVGGGMIGNPVEKKDLVEAHGQERSKFRRRGTLAQVVHPGIEAPLVAKTAPYDFAGKCGSGGPGGVVFRKGAILLPAGEQFESENAVLGIIHAESAMGQGFT